MSSAEVPEDDQRWSDQIKRMERDNSRKRQELLLQAENAFKMQEEAYSVELVRLKAELERQKQINEGIEDLLKSLQKLVFQY